MARGSSQANTAATSAQDISNQSSANANALFSTLAPGLESEMANPTGFNPADMAAMETAQEQGAGGTEAGAVGEGLLHAARTRNAGGADAQIGQSAREAGQQLSRGVLGSQIANANLKNQNRLAATSGLEGLYGTDLGESVGALGQVSNAVNANTNAENASWDWSKYLLDPFLSAASGAAPTIYQAFK